MITATIEDGIGYEVAQFGNSASVTVLDNDPPILSITSITSSISESEDAWFQISATSVADSSFPVIITVNDFGDFVDESSGIRVLTFPATDDNLVFSIAINDDEVDEPNNRFTVRILESNDASYLVSTKPNDRAQVLVQDNDENIVTMSVASTVIDESGQIEIIINSSNVAPAAGLNVYFDIVEIGNFLLYSTSNRAFILSGQSTTSKLIRIRDDQTPERNGQVSIELLPSSGYFLDETATNKITVQIIDNDVPAGLSIQPLVGSIAEGDSAQFRVTADSVSSQPRSVSINMTQRNGNFIQGPQAEIVIIEADEQSVDFEIETEADGQVNSSGEITATLAPSEDYQLAETLTSATVYVENTDLPAGISIVAVTEEIVEGDAIPFIIFASSTESYDRTILFEVNQGSSDFLPQTVPNSVILSADESIAEISIPTSTDFQDEPNARISVSIVAGQNYLPASSPDNSASVLVKDDDLIEVAIEALTPTSFGEGIDGYFRIYASSPTFENLPITVQISQEGDFLVDDSPERTVNLSAFSISNTLVVNTVEDNIDEGNGQITATIKPNQNYEVANSPYNSALLSVIDDDLIVASFTTQPTSVTEGEELVLALETSLPAPVGGLNINLAISQTGDVIDGFISSSVVQITEGEDSGQVQIPLKSDDIFEHNGQVTITIASGTGYSPSVSENQLIIPVLDDDAPIGISVLPVNSQVAKGDDAVFLIKSDRSIPVARTVRFDVFQTIDGVNTEITRHFLNMPELATEARFSVTIPDNEIYADSSVTVTLRPSLGYHVANTYSSAVITVSEPIPSFGISVVALSESVVEGGVAQIKVVAASTFDTERNVRYAIQSGRENVELLSLPEYFTIPAGETEQVVNIQTSQNSVNQPNAPVTIRLLPGINYTLVSNPNERVTIPIIDDDQPLISVSIPIIDEDLPQLSVSTPSNDPITEGEDAVFIISATSAPTAPLSISVEVYESGDFLVPVIPSTVAYPAGETSTRIFFQTQADETIEANGFVEIELIPGSGYAVAPAPDDIAAVHINSDDFVEVSVAGPAEDITKLEAYDDGIEFTLSFSNPVPASGLRINLEYTSDYDLYFNNEATKLRVRPGELRASVIIYLDSNDYIPNGYVRARVLPGENYVPADSQGNEDTIYIDDPDAPPGVKIFPVSESVEEGQSAIFGIYIDQERTQDWEIDILVENSVGTFLDQTNIPTTVEVGANWYLEDYVELAVATIDNDVSEIDGVITVTLSESNQYTLASSYTSASVVITNNDIADGVSIIPYKENFEITESVQFGILASNQVPFDRTINVDIRENQGSYLPLPLPESVTLPANETSAIITLVPRTAPLGGSISQITARIIPGENYSVSEENYETTVTLQDSLIPTVSLISAPDSVLSGGTVEWQFEIDPPSRTDFDIDLTITKDGQAESINLGVEVGQSAVSYSISPLANNQVSITIENNQAYSNGGYKNNADSRDAVITNSVSDASPVVFVNAISQAISEGDFAQFEIVSYPAPRLNTEISISFSESVDGYLVDTLPQTTTIVAGQTSKIISIPTIDNDQKLSDESVLALTVTSGTGYILHQQMASATIVAVDNDEITGVPLVSIEAVKAVYYWGQKAIFEFTLSEPIATNLTARARIGSSDNGRVHDIVFTPGITKQYAAISTLQYGDRELNTLTLTLLESLDYQIASAPNNQTTIAIDEAVLSVSPENDSINPDEYMYFIVHSSIRFDEEFYYTYDLTGG